MNRAIAALVGIAGLTAAASANTVVDFNDLTHGEIVNTQYTGLGLTIDGTNPNRDHNLVVAFDTSLTGTRDEDLEGPGWDGGNLAASRALLERALIIQENDRGIGDGIADRPDDEGRRPAGTICFQFDSVMTGFGFDVVDIEGVTMEMTSIDFILDGDVMATLEFTDLVDSNSDFYDASIEFGNNSANRVSMITTDDLDIAGFDKVRINVGGSSAWDNVRFVPSPGTLALAGLGGLAVARRRR